jgi:hypothetical protein
VAAKLHHAAQFHRFPVAARPGETHLSTLITGDAMTQLLDAATQFPTVVFTVGLGIALLYWVFVIVGALDLDVLGGGDVSGAAKGIGDAIAGAGKGAGDALGAAKGAGDAAGVHDGGFWHALGLATVPITISVSVVLLIGWIGSILAMQYLPAVTGDLAGWLAPLVFFVVLVAALMAGGRLVRPLAPLFVVREAKTNREYVGSVCTLTTGRVDHDFGQATVEEGGTVLVIPVRCDRDNTLARGQRALIIDYDTARNAYVIEPADPLLTGDGAAA